MKTAVFRTQGPVVNKIKRRGMIDDDDLVGWWLVEQSGQQSIAVAVLRC